MTPRPPIGARVRVRGTTGIPNVAGRVGVIAAHHEDGIAVAVDLVIGERIIVEPSDVDVTQYDAQPARVGRGES
jgi:hypothetical protein